MIMKVILVTLIVAICVQSVFSERNLNEPGRSRSRRRRITRPATKNPTESIDFWDSTAALPWEQSNQWDGTPPSWNKFNKWNAGAYPPFKSSISPALAMRINQFHRNANEFSNTVQNPDREPETVIKGENGVIEVDGKVVEKNDTKFKNEHSVCVSIVQGQISINGKKVFKGKPSQLHGASSTNINSTLITSFKIEIFEDGQLLFTDNNGSITRATL